MLNKQEFRKFAVKHQGLSGLGVDQYIQHVEGQTRGGLIMPTGMTRSVIEERPTRFAEIDVFSRLIMDRIVFLGTAVDDYIANILTAQMLFLESADAKKDILLYINSPGGSVYAGLGIYDTMQYVNPDVATICTGLAASMGAVLLAGGAANKRSALPHARVMIHQPSGGAQASRRTSKSRPARFSSSRRSCMTFWPSTPAKPTRKFTTTRTATTGCAPTSQRVRPD
jgi:ATP-dependent Clp protease protease subunit